MSTLNVNTIAPANPGSETYFLAKAWGNFSGSTGAIVADGNVSTVTDLGTGIFQMNFTTALSDAYFATAGSTTNTAQNYLFQLDVFSRATTNVYVRTHDYNSLQDVANAFVTVTR